MADGDLSGRTLGDIVLGELIGEGGHGAIYRGTQPLLRRDVVVKVLHGRRRRDPLAQQRFLREAQLASQLDDPYAAHIYAFDIEEEDGLVWIAMELVPGVNLHQWLATRGPMSVEQFVPFFEKVAQVVHAAHEHRIVHRDLKPSNVMVIERGGDLIPKLLDFGIAKARSEDASMSPGLVAAAATGSQADRARERTARLRRRPSEPATPTRTDPNRMLGPPHLTKPGAGIGSAAYMSPEQWQDAHEVGPATDIYALGVLAYKTLTGVEPFAGQSTDDYYRMHVSAKAAPLGDGFAPEIDTVIQRALAKTPKDRHGSALEMASALRAALRSSKREHLRSSAQQWSDRHRAPGFLWGRDALPELHDWAHRTPPGKLTPLECSFVAASFRHARRGVWIGRALIALIVLAVVGGFQYRATMQARLAAQRADLQTQLAETTVTQSELEQGRAALLHAEPEAALHLAQAFRRDPRSSTAFMYARALQPRLAEQHRFASSKGRMWSAAFSPDGRSVITTDDDSAQIWDAQSGRRVVTLPHGDTVYAAVYFPDGRRLATAAGDGAARIWNAENGSLIRELRHGTAQLRYALVALSPNGRFVAAMDLAVAHVWDVESGAFVAEMRTGPSSGSPSLAFSADNQWLAISGGNDVRVFKVGAWTRSLTLAGPGIDAVSWDPRGPRLLTGSADGDVSIWRVPDGVRVRHLRDVGTAVDAVAFSPNGRLVAAATRNGDEQVWAAASGALESQANPLRSKIRAIEFDRTSTRLVAAGTSGAVAVTDAKDGTAIATLEGPQNVVMVARFDRDSRRVVAASWDGTARIWDATPSYRSWSAPAVDSDCGLITSLEPDRRFVAVGCKEHPTQIWDTARGQLLAELPSVTSVEGDFASAYPAVSAAGDRAAIARGRVVQVFAVTGAQLISSITHDAAVTTVAFGAGHDLVTGAVDGSLIVTRDNGSVTAFPTASSGIDSAVFLPDGRILAAAADRHLRVYDRGGAILAELVTSARVRMLRMSLDGRRLVTVPSFVGAPASPWA